MEALILNTNTVMLWRISSTGDAAILPQNSPSVGSRTENCRPNIGLHVFCEHFVFYGQNGEKSGKFWIVFWG